MKMSFKGFILSLCLVAGSVQAEQMLTVDGEEYPLSELMAVCQNMGDQPAGQLACFSDLTKLMAEQSAAAQEPVVPVPEALNALRAVAQYQDDNTGLLIAGTDCNIQIIYYGNYFHVSRRNISEIDLFSVQFDAANLPIDQVSELSGAQVPMIEATLNAGTTAIMHGAIGLDSARNGFAPRTPGTTLDVYASEVISQLQPREDSKASFVLLHPQRLDASADIQGAFDTFLKACAD